MNRPILNEIHSIFNIIRQLVHENRRLYDSIDESYEEILIEDLKLIPEQCDDDILKIIHSIKLIITNINFTAISQGIDDLTGGILHFNVNTYNVFKDGLNKIDLSKKDKARINNIVSKFKPLFSAIDEMLSEPLIYIRKIAQLTSTQYDNIL